MDNNIQNAPSKNPLPQPPLDESTNLKTPAGSFKQPLSQTPTPPVNNPTSPLPTSQTPQFPTINKPPDSVISEKKKRLPLFNIIIILFLLLAISIWAGVGYLYIQNNNLKDKTSETILEEKISTPTPTPTPAFSPEQIKIESGNVIWERPDGEITVIIDKGNYKTTGITGFAKVVVSPDENWICAESWPPAPDPSLYIANIEGENVIKVNSNRNSCLWSQDSKSITYINSSAPNTQTDIYIYNNELGEETNLTRSAFDDGVVRKYKVVGFNADGSKLICEYTQIPQAEEGQGSCEVDIETGNVELNII